ncbi:MAG: acyltransferase family protein [Bacillota bacterium]
MKALNKERDERIDILRFIAIIGILVAHSNPDPWLFQLRNFDVTLMVLLLGTSFYLSQRGKELNYLPYLGKRFNRLVVPTWQLLVIFFALFYLISKLFGDEYYFPMEEVIDSFALMEGIGYVWIMRVFFLIALISPLLLAISNRIKNNTVYFLFLVAGYFLYIGLLLINGKLEGNMGMVFQNFVVYGVGYGLVAAFGMRLKQFSAKEIWFYFLFFLGIFLYLMFQNDFAQTQAFKYPPQLYYFAYGLMGSLFLYILLDVSFIKKIFTNKFVAFVSRTSLWLYLWHIIFVEFMKLFESEMSIISDSFITRFLYIFITSLIVTYIQEMVKKYMKNRKRNQASIS